MKAPTKPKTYAASPERGFPYRKVAREIAERREGGSFNITPGEVRRIAREAFQGLCEGSRDGSGPQLIDLRDAAFAISVAIADQFERALLVELRRVGMHDSTKQTKARKA